MPTIASDSKPVRSDDVVHFPSGDQVCLHNLDTGEYILLNSVASAVWELCDGVLTVAQIAERITHDYDVEYEIALADTFELLEDLGSEGCLE